jgi:poly-gamma-glutamate synthesis protein (capsule biosynthesis protein)
MAMNSIKRLMNSRMLWVFPLGTVCALLATSYAPRAPMQHTGPGDRHDSMEVAARSDTVILRFGGDCLLAEHYETDVRDDSGRAFRDFELLRTADIAMVNLECPVTVRGSKVRKPFNFRMKPEFVSVLKGAGIDVVNMANNHVFDFGKVGLFDTISYLDSAGIGHVGAGRNINEAHRAAIMTISGKKVGFLGYYGGGEAPGATDKTPGVARPEIRQIATDIESLRIKDSVQFIVVNLHWGTEKARTPDSRQIELGHRIIDAGADAVIGHHPHVLQGIERYKNGVLVYSLGNFIFGGNSQSSYDTGLFEILLTGNSVYYKFVPVRITDWHAEQLQDEDMKNLVRRVAYLSRQFRKSIFGTEETR